MLPERVKLSQKVTDKLRNLTQHTKLTPNILARIAIMLALKESGDLSNAGVADNDGKELGKSTLFGEYIDTYDVMIRQYIHEKKIKLDTQQVIVALIEIGIHKIGHVKKLEDVCDLVE